MTGRPGLNSSHPAVLKSPVARSSASAPRPPGHTALQVHLYPQFYLAPILPPSFCQSWAGESWSDGLDKCRICGQPREPSIPALLAAATATISWGLAWASSSPPATWLLALPLPLLLSVASSPPAGPAKSRAGKAVLGHADLKILLPSTRLCAVISISKQLSLVWLMCCPALMVLGTRDWIGRYPISLLWSAQPSNILTGRGPLGPPCRRSSVLGLTSSAALASPGRGISRFPPIPSPSPLPGLPPRISLQIPIAALVDWLPPMAPATATLLLHLAS